MNIAVIFAGGVGSRMQNAELPKQFIEIDSIPILIHTLQKFERNENVDRIVLVMLDTWIPYTRQLLEKFTISKLDSIVAGGQTGQMSIFNGINEAYRLYPEDSTVLIHDGVRPFISQELINQNIESVKNFGSSISSVAAIETFLITDENNKVVSIPNRENSIIAKAPQAFRLNLIYEAHMKAQSENKISFIDSSTLMYHYGYDLHVDFTDHNNIKVTTPKDIDLAHAIYHQFYKKEN